MKTSNPPARLALRVSKSGKTAVLMRRGPSRWTRLIAWDTTQDTFDAGQWIQSSIRYFDVSADGTYVVYFVNGHKKRKPYLWIGLSKAPRFTAEKIWPVRSAWGGQCAFVDNVTICIETDFPEDAALDERCGRFRIVGPKTFSGNARDAARRHNGWNVDRRALKIISPYLSEWEETAEKPNPRFPELRLVRTASYRDGKLSGNLLLQRGTEREVLNEFRDCDWDAQGRLLFCDALGNVGVRTFNAKLAAQTRILTHFNDQVPEAIP